MAAAGLQVHLGEQLQKPPQARETNRKRKEEAAQVFAVVFGFNSRGLVRAGTPDGLHGQWTEIHAEVGKKKSSCVHRDHTHLRQDREFRCGLSVGQEVDQAAAQTHLKELNQCVQVKAEDQSCQT